VYFWTLGNTLGSKPIYFGVLNQ